MDTLQQSLNGTGKDAHRSTTTTGSSRIGSNCRRIGSSRRRVGSRIDDSRSSIHVDITQQHGAKGQEAVDRMRLCQILKVPRFESNETSRRGQDLRTLWPDRCKGTDRTGRGQSQRSYC